MRWSASLRRLAPVLAVALSLSACDRLPAWLGGPDGNRGPLLAEVGAQRLYLGDLAGIVPPGAAAADSAATVRAFAERWTRAAVLADEAERELGADAELERLVADYRTSLLRSRYEDRLVAGAVDSVVAEAELQTLYEQAAGSLATESGLARVLLFKFAENFPEREAFEDAWRQLGGADDAAAVAELSDLGEAYALVALDDPAQWYELAQVEALLPDGRLGSTPDVSSVIVAEGARWYVRPLERVAPGGRAPFAYVRERLRKLALERRRADFLAEAEARLYADAQARGDIKLYTGSD